MIFDSDLIYFMASFIDDIARVRDVLQANAVDKVVDEGIINALLEVDIILAS